MKHDAAEKVLDLIEQVTALTDRISDWSSEPAEVYSEAASQFYTEEARIPKNLPPEFLRSPLRMMVLSGPNEKRDWFELSEVREIADVRRVRGRVTQLMPIMVGMVIRRIGSNGALIDGEDVYAGYCGDGRWREITNPLARQTTQHIHINNIRSPEEMTEQIGLLCGIQFAREYDWTVTIGFRTGIHIRLSTNATGVNEFLALRDKRVGGIRRPALRHWVEEHWRVIPSSPEVETQVRAHLRGKEAYNWGDLDGYVIPSAVSLEMAAAEADRREELGPLHRPISRGSKASELRSAHIARATAYRADYERHLRGEGKNPT